MIFIHSHYEMYSRELHELVQIICRKGKWQIYSGQGAACCQFGEFVEFRDRGVCFQLELALANHTKVSSGNLLKQE